MASGFTNRGKKLMAEAYFKAGTAPTQFYLALCTDATAPGADTNLMSDLTQIPTGNGYTDGGITIERSATGFDVSTEDDALDKHYLQLKDAVFTASGGNLPASGTGARWAVLTDDNATVGSRQIIAYFDLVSNRIVSDTQALTIQNSQLDITE